MARLPVGIAGVNGVLRVCVVLEGAPLLLSKDFLNNFGCHIDLGCGYLFFEKLDVRVVVTSKQPRIPIKAETNRSKTCVTKRVAIGRTGEGDG